MKTLKMRITPKMAEIMLLRNHKNRDPRKGHVSFLAGQMLNGKFLLTHQGIAFDAGGVLIDGQHRLMAIVESGVTVTMVVSWGCSDLSRLYTDDHAKRSGSDAVSFIEGMEHATVRHTAIVSVMDSDSPGYSNRSIKDRSILVGMLKRHIEAIDFAIDCFGPTKYAGVSQARVLAVVARAYYTRDRDKLKRFAELLRTGEMTSIGDVAAITLRNWLLTTGRNAGAHAGKVSKKDIYLKTERMLEAYLNGEVLRRCVSAKTELFDIPK